MQYESNVGLLIGIPTLFRPVTIEWAMALRGQVPPINFNASLLIVPNQQVAIAREQIAEKAVEMNAKYLFFIGDDTEPPLHALKQFIFRMEQMPDLGVVGGIYCTKSEPSFPLVFRGNGSGSYWDWKIGEFFECSGLGMDCTLIRTEMLKALPKPWFKTIDTDNFMDGNNHAEMWTEDLYFCKNVLDNTQYKIYADATVMPKHWDSQAHKFYSVPVDSLPTRRLSTNGKKTMLDIGAGGIRREFEDYDVHTVDIREECNPDYRCDVRQLPFADSSYDAIFSSHVLEHFSREEHARVLHEWVRVLKPGGEFIIVVPTIDWAVDQLKDRHVMTPETEMHVWNVLYGGQSNPYDFHKNGFTINTLESLLLSLDCTVTSKELGPMYNLTVRGTKNGDN